MATIRFYLKPLSNGTAQIIAAFQSGSEQPTKYTGYTIPSTKSGKGEYKHWNKKKQRVVSLEDKGDEINKKLSNWSTSFDTYITDCNLNGEAPDVHYIMSKLDGVYKSKAKNNKGKGPTLLSVVAAFRESIKLTHEVPTRKAYATLETQLQEFEKHTGKTYYVTDIGAEFYKEFSIYLIEEETNFNAVIVKKQGRIGTILDWSIESLGVKDLKADYRKIYKLKTIKAPKFPLLDAELTALWYNNTDEAFATLIADHAEALANWEANRNSKVPHHIYLAKTRLGKTEKQLLHQRVLDGFLLCCETGMRYSDLSQLKPLHLQSYVSEHDGIVRYIDFAASVKADKANSIPLSDRACIIIDRYLPFADTPEKQLFKYSASQAFNDMLKGIFEDKELSRACEIVTMQGPTAERSVEPLYQVVSIHMARNTYITRLLNAGLAPVHVRDNAGHSKIEITMGYFRGRDHVRFEETLRILNK
jgi:integrase